jgi:hypothetical protein
MRNTDGSSLAGVWDHSSGGQSILRKVIIDREPSIYLPQYQVSLYIIQTVEIKDTIIRRPSPTLIGGITDCKLNSGLSDEEGLCGIDREYNRFFPHRDQIRENITDAVMGKLIEEVKDQAEKSRLQKFKDCIKSLKIIIVRY